MVTDNGPAERPPIDLFKSIFESESESDSAEDEEGEQESTLEAAGEPSVTSPGPQAECQRAPHGLFGKTPVDRGYGTDSSEDSSPRQVGGGHQVDDDAGGAGGEGPNIPGEKTKSVRDVDKRSRRRESSSKKHSSRKHGSSKKHKKKHRSEKRDRKHDHKRKRSSSSKRYFSS